MVLVNDFRSDVLPVNNSDSDSDWYLQVTTGTKCILLKTSFSRISSIFYSFLNIHDRAKSLQRTDIVSAVL